MSGRLYAADPAAAERAAAGLLAPGDPVLVEATIADYMAGDSCVLIRTGRPNNGSSFWVPTLHIHTPAGLRLQLQTAEQAGIPDYNVLDALREVGSPWWDWRRRA